MQKTRKRSHNGAPTQQSHFVEAAVTTLAQRQYEKLRESIIAMDLPPGSPISESLLAEKSGISRTPVREAILRLAREKLVEVVPKSGTFVARIPVSALPEALIARRALEGMTARAAAKFAKRSQVLELYAILEQQRELSDRADILNFHISDELFHKKIAVIGRLPGLWVMTQQIKLQVDRFRRLTLPEAGRMTMVIDEHLAVTEAIESRNPDKAYHTMEHHLAGLQLHIKSVVESHPDFFIHDADLDNLVRI